MSTEAASTGPVAFGRYTLLERLAVGGMAEVFRARISSSHGFEKILVIKRILPQLAADPEFVAMFVDEAKLTAQLTHPKIVQVLDFGSVDGEFFAALEYVEGFDALALLRTAAQKRVHIPHRLSIFVISEVLEALDYAHNARDMDGRPMQIVHRDISPSNIFMSKRGDVKLGDFGIAHTRRRESKTQAGALKGKYGYMSPEQVVGRPIDARSDLFAVGIVLAELLTGRRLFTAANDLDVLLKVRDVRLDRLDKYGTSLAPGLADIVRRALKKDPHARFQTAAALRDALGDHLFSTGQRVGPNDLRVFAATLFGTPIEPAAVAAGGAETEDAAPLPTGVATPSRPIAISPPAAPDSAPANTGGGDSWPDDERGERSSSGGFTPVAEAGAGGAATPAPRRPDPGAARPPGDIGRFVSGAPDRPPDSAGDLAVITPMRLFCDLALGDETGLLRFENGDSQKEIFLVGGAPESVGSNHASERFGEYLVSKQVLTPADLELALSMLPHYNGKLGDTLVALGMLRPLDVFRLLSRQVRDRVIDVFAWSEGTFAFYRGVSNRQDNFPLGLDTFEILGAGVVSLPRPLLDQRFESLLDLSPVVTGRSRLSPEAFRIGPTPREVLEMIVGTRTLRDWLAQFADPDERSTFLRAMYLLVETDLVELD